jgi:uncharacterized protein YyaL (SSP411 family)
MANAMGKTFSQIVERSPTAFAQFLIGVEYTLGPSYEIVVAGDSNGNDTNKILEVLRKIFIPNKILLLRPTESENPNILKYIHFLKDKIKVDGRAALYICKDYSCKSPITSPDEIQKVFQGEK